MPEQFRGRIEVGSERQHHRSKRVARRMKSKALVYTRSLCPRFEYDIYIRRRGQVENDISRFEPAIARRTPPPPAMSRVMLPL